MELAFSGRDFNLGIFIPKQGLDDATADEFAKTNKINNDDDNITLRFNKTQQMK